MLLKISNELFQIAILLCCLIVTARGFELVQVPKNKSVKASSIGPGTAQPIAINDGIINATLLVHTNSLDPQPWLMLDLEQSYVIFSARIYNRRDEWAHRFTQIKFGVTNNPSVWTTFNKDLFDICYYYTQVPTAEENPINITCTQPVAGRYLTMYMNVTGITDDNLKYIHIYEIDVFALANGTLLYNRNAQLSLTAGTSVLLAQRQLRSNMECLIWCMNLQPNCLFALVISGSGDCLLFGPTGTASGLVASKYFNITAV
uniref:F5/8 type C domain-containing protein n=1 Tax=Macrostomum lignano TaxID=282301 RepID=A0A1I8J408_9PLAT